MQSFKKVLIANRGEIAVRVLRALQEVDVRSAVIYSDADRGSLAVRLADEAYNIGPAPSAQSYLRFEAIVDLAVRIGADAIHPGYGFLSENAEFARCCAASKVKFIGPSPEAMDAMGKKIESRKLMIAAGVPVVPGGTEALASVDEAARAAEQIGYPVMLKASAGGGGKGMRMVHDEGDLKEAFRAATSEAGASFGDSSVYVEKYIERPRHVEIQVLGDSFGQVISLGERECSLQRRHQKVVEEAPSTVVDPDLRARMGEAAVKAARAVSYEGAGTVEFLLDSSGAFYFLEMNTRLQVEHPVTELVTGVDLVQEQLRVARGGAIDPALGTRQPRGHAIEVRLYAEDPFRGFAPSPGLIHTLRWPQGPGVRVDAGVELGSEVTIFYDPMLAKLIVWGADRSQALRRLRRALRELRVGGIKTTAPLFLALLEDEEFLHGDFDIDWLDRKLKSGVLRDPDASPEIPTEPTSRDDAAFLTAALAHLLETASASASSAQLATTVGAGRLWRQAGRREGVG